MAMPVKTGLQKPEWSQNTRDRLGRLVMGVGLALLLAFPIRTWLARRMVRNLPAGPPTDLYRIRSAAMTGLLHAWLPSMAALAIYLSLVTGDGLTPDAAELASDALLAVVLGVIVVSIARAALRPNRSLLRLAPLSDAGARRVYWVVVGLAWLFAVHFVLSSSLKSRDVSLEVIATELLVFSSLVALVLSGLLSHQVWTRPGQLQLTSMRRGQRFLLGVLIIAIPVSAMTGYVGLSRLLAIHGVSTMALFALLVLLMRISDEFVAQLLCVESRTGIYLRRQLALTGEDAEMLGFWVVVAMKAFILTAGGLALLFLWSLDRKDLMLWLREIFQGFKLGNITISPAEILLGLLLFTVLLTATRLIQQALDRRIFPRTRLDMGARTSIRAAVGYAGFTLAALFGISTMGIDFSSLAMIAGALSVGIGEHQGYVKKISVRATEVTTFDRASVFIPNSSLISGTVMNRTHADKIGRVVLPIGIDYDGDVTKARALLLSIAEDQFGVLDNPAPAVFMTGFGDSALNLELVAFVHDVDKVKSVASELLFTIHDAFRQHDIQIPYPQRDLKLTLDDEQLKRMFQDTKASEPTR
jgi:small-conductance mechanosensitive channel